ncbi:MAG: HAMP domain-containing sensor histidine kinase [Ginsengibacter sp.]
MSIKKFSIFRRITILIFVLISALSLLFTVITYFATTRFYQASTQLLNKDVAAHIAKFSSPYESDGINKSKADSVFQDAMVISPSAEVYFLDTAGKVVAYHANNAAIKNWNLPLDKIKRYLGSQGRAYIKGPDPRDPENQKIFSASEVFDHGLKLGYIYVIFTSNEYRNVTQMLYNSQVTNFAIVSFICIILLSVIVSLVYLNRIQRSFTRMLNVLKRFEQGDFEPRFKIQEQHELAPVTSAFNNLADLLVLNINSLTKSEKNRQDFIATISHDLRTPLAIIRGYAETLLIKKQSSLSPEERDNYIQMILNKIMQVENMVKDLFELSKMESVEFRANKEPFVLSEIVQETVNTFQLNSSYKNIDLQCTQCLYHVWINADISLMERVVQNLVDNAVKNTSENGKIEVAMAVENKDLIFRIENFGKLLPQNVLLWINSPVTENGNYSDRPSKQGLGLVIVKRILGLHSTNLKASVTNSSNVFSFSLPVYDPVTNN